MTDTYLFIILKNMEQTCPNCNATPLIRFHKDNQVYCNRCDELLTKSVDNYSNDTYVKCPTCGYSGEELINPRYETMCPQCNNPVLHH